jgi:hypothetical protein
MPRPKSLRILQPSIPDSFDAFEYVEQEAMDAHAQQHGLTGKVGAFVNALWPTLFWMIIATIIMANVSPDWRSPDTAHKGQIMPPAPPAASATVQPCR